MSRAVLVGAGVGGEDVVYRNRKDKFYFWLEMGILSGGGFLWAKLMASVPARDAGVVNEE